LSVQYSITFYLTYLSRWPDLCCTQQAASGALMSYVLGKVEGHGTEWHGHVTALTVAPEYRRLHLGQNMMHLLERISDKVYRGYFVDLYVRLSNIKAIGMYEGLGYSVYRRVKEYYGSMGPGEVENEDAYDMRKPLPRDIGHRSIRANGKDILVSAAEVS